MIILLTILIPVNVGLLGMTVSAFNSFYNSLKEEYPLEIVNSVERRPIFWISVVLNLIFVGANIAFLTGLLPATLRFNIPKLPPFQIPAEYVALSMTALSVILLGFVLSFRSPFGLVRIDPDRIGRAIERMPSSHRLTLLTGLANSRYTKSDLKGWGDALLHLENAISTQLKEEQHKQGMQVEPAILQALDQLQKFDAAIPSSAYAATLIERLEKIAEVSFTHGYEHLSMRVALHIINLSTIDPNKPGHTIDQRYVQGVGLRALSLLADQALEHSKPMIAEAVLKGVHSKLHEAQKIGIVVLQETCLNAIPFYCLVWESSLRTLHPAVARKAVGLLCETGRLGLETDNLWLTALSIGKLQQLADTCTGLPDEEKTFFSITILKDLVSISKHCRSEHRAVVDHAVVVSCIQVLTRCLPSTLHVEFLKELEFGEPAHALSRALNNSMHGNLIMNLGSEYFGTLSEGLDGVGNSQNGG